MPPSESRHWLWIPASLVLAALVGISFLTLSSKTHEAPLPHLTTADDVSLAFHRRIYNEALSQELASVQATITAAGPLFAPENSSVNLFEFGPDLNLEGARQLETTTFYAASFTPERDLQYLSGDCQKEQGKWSVCSPVSQLSPKSFEKDPLNSKELHLDVHEWEPDGSGGNWAIQYQEVTCDADNAEKCGVGIDGIPVEHIINCRIVHVVDGSITKTWSAMDHLPPSETTRSRYNENFDTFHCNSVEAYEVFDRPKILISMRHTDSIYQVDVATGDVDWKLGGNEWPGKSLTIANPGSLGMSNDSNDSSSFLSGQHDARYLGNNTFSVFDNGTLTGRPARGIIFSLDAPSRIVTVLKVFNNPEGITSLCTGSFRPMDDERYWVAGWGCSSSGITVFASDTTPIVSTQLDVSDAKTLAATSDALPPVRSSLSYRAIVTP